MGEKEQRLRPREESVNGTLESFCNLAHRFSHYPGQVRSRTRDQQ